jgi:hypothetical protein
MSTSRTILSCTALVIALIGLALTFKTWWGSQRLGVASLHIGSPYQNTRYAVKYVGDEVCARCHAEIAEAYHQHPMGRSLVPIEAALAIAIGHTDGQPLFEAQGIQYAIAHRDGRLVHQETRRKASGDIVAQNEAEVRFVLGAGRQGFSYLIERDGFLFQSPISWYAQMGVGTSRQAMRS